MIQNARCFIIEEIEFWDMFRSNCYLFWPDEIFFKPDFLEVKNEKKTYECSKRSPRVFKDCNESER